jgi:HK97 gp10 family phage protein
LIVIELRGFDKFINFCKEFPLKSRIAFDEFSNESSRLIADRARRKAPYRTGRLRSSIKALNGRVEAQAPYALFIEYGTKKMKAKPFLRTAINELIEELRRILASEIKDVFGLR